MTEPQRLDAPCDYPDDSLGKTFFDMLVFNGLWNNEANAVLAKIKADENEITISLRELLSKPAQDYSTATITTLWMGVKVIAVEWLKANKPVHMAIQMLDTDTYDTDAKG